MIQLLHNEDLQISMSIHSFQIISDIIPNTCIQMSLCDKSLFCFFQHFLFKIGKKNQERLLRSSNQIINRENVI